MRRALCGVALLVASCALDARLPEGKIACRVASDCPPSWSCIADMAEAEGLCYRTSEGAFAMRDAGSRDAAMTAPDGAVAPVDGGDHGGSNGADGGDGKDASSDLDAALNPGDGGSSGNQAPMITAVVLGKSITTEGTKVSVTCLASDPDSETLSFAWSAKAGTFDDPDAKSTSYVATGVGARDLRCHVEDGEGGQAEQAARLRVYPSGLVTLLPFSLDDQDKSGNGNHVSIAQGVFANDRAGNPSSAVALDGVDSKLTLLNESAYDLTGFSFVVTLKPLASSSTRTIVAKASSGFGAFSVLLYGDDDASLPGQLQFIQEGQMGTYPVVLGDYQATAGKFLQLAVTRSTGGVLRAYVDGSLIHEQVGLPAPVQNDSPVVLGNGPLGAFAGTMDEVQVYNRDLTEQEVMALTTLQ